MLLEASEIAHKAVSAALDIQASDIVLLDIRKPGGFADYFVICNAETKRQMEAVGEEVDKQLTLQGAKLIHREGNNESGWLLLDFGAVIVHIFSPDQREFYQLDKLWGEAPVVVKIQ